METGGEMVRAAAGKAPAWRWGILAFAVASVIINGFDRQMVAMLKPDILGDFGWDDADYGRLASLFQLGSVGTLLFAGWFLDRVGLKWGYAIGNGLWSGVTLLHVMVTSFGGFIALRVALGATESIQTPAAVKSVASYFPQKETSLALGIVNAAPNVGAIIVPLAIPAMALAVGWRMSFVLVGAIGLIWVLVWLVARPPSPPTTVSLTALEASDTKWSDLLKDRRVHGFMMAKVLTDQMWWLMMFWLPDFFMRTFGLTAAEVARPTAFVYVLAMAGALTSGWLAGRIIASGVPAATARIRVLVGYGSIALVAPLALYAGDLWLAALLIGIVLFAHQGFSTNLFACVVDVFPARRVASVVSMGALAGNLWGAAVLEITGQLLAGGGTYLPLFIAGGSGYLLAVLVIRGLILRQPSY
jgi:MFS transporter, ACS family, hexuronate transporter